MAKLIGIFKRTVNPPVSKQDRIIGVIINTDADNFFNVNQTTIKIRHNAEIRACANAYLTEFPASKLIIGIPVTFLSDTDLTVSTNSFI